MWQGANGKNYRKAFTLSFDDGIWQDERLIGLLKEYGLKATFNINTGLAGWMNTFVCNGVKVNHFHWTESEAKEVYKDQEVAVHTLTHRNLTELTEEEVVREVEEDRLTLEKWFSRPVHGMAYPCGGVNNDSRTADILRRRTNVKYSRTIDDTYSFDCPSPDSLLRFHPTVHQWEAEKMESLADEFILADGSEEKPLLFFLWGHAYEYDCSSGLWDAFRRTLDKLCACGDIFFGTNSEVLLNREK